MSLSKTLYPLLSTGSTKKTGPDITEKVLTGTLRIKTNKTNTPKIRNGLTLLIKVDKSMGLKWVKVSYFDQSMFGINRAS